MVSFSQFSCTYVIIYHSNVVYVEIFEGHGAPPTIGLKFGNERPIFINTKSYLLLYFP